MYDPEPSGCTRPFDGRSAKASITFRWHSDSDLTPEDLWYEGVFADYRRYDSERGWVEVSMNEYHLEMREQIDLALQWVSNFWAGHVVHIEWDLDAECRAEVARLDAALSSGSVFLPKCIHVGPDRDYSLCDRHDSG
ncbi:hypothetical protein [Nocardia sp. NPDC058705]|uniref:hypothetical protein n=1 Tax=Nocardia sp. NPDC058705 TaxID=3346609 RepID=UPI003684AB81